MIIHEIEQRTPAWAAIRMGKYTASIFADLMPAKSKPADSWTETQTKAMYAVVAERMTGVKPQGFESYAMQWGTLNEDQAREVYEVENAVKVGKVGFVELSDWIGCSPDGFIGEDGLIEIKCPNSDTHLMYSTIPGKLSDAYYWQVMGQLWITGRKWCDLVSFDPRFKEYTDQIYTVRIERDEEAIKRLSDRMETVVAIAETIYRGNK
jgi:putative phage-type endonuclease